MTNPEIVSNSENAANENGDPDALDTGDFTEVPPEQRVDHDDDPPNEDADDPLTDVQEGQVVNLADTEDDDDDDDDEPEEQDSGDGNPPATSGPPAQEEQGPSSAGG